MGRFLILSVAVLAASIAVTTTPAANAATTACDLISLSHLKSILGQQHIAIVDEAPGTSAVDNPSGMTHSYCNGVAFTGAAPKTPAAVRRAAANGTGVGFAIDTWAPDEASSDVDSWTLGGFADFVDLITATGLEALLAPGLPLFQSNHVHTLTPVGTQFGGDGALGMTMTPRAIPRARGIGGAWWSSQSAAVIAIGFETSTGRATVKRLNQLAKLAVSDFGLNPIPLH
jgi:hypothetical protein